MKSTIVTFNQSISQVNENEKSIQANVEIIEEARQNGRKERDDSLKFK